MHALANTAAHTCCDKLHLVFAVTPAIGPNPHGAQTVIAAGKRLHCGATRTFYCTIVAEETQQTDAEFAPRKAEVVLEYITSYINQLSYSKKHLVPC